MTTPAPVTLGLRANWRQFGLLLLINAFVGAMVGLERTILPLIAGEEFGLASRSASLSFLIGFGAVKALSNLFAGYFSDRLGRKKILVAGWLAGLPVPLLLAFAPAWSWIVVANLLLGLNQGLCWSTTVIMKIDLVGPRRRGLAMGLNESAGYVAVSLAALLTGYLATRYGLRPVPFYPGIVLALLGLLLSGLFVRETHDHARHEATLQTGGQRAGLPPLGATLRDGFKNPTLFAINQVGLVNNLNDALVWGLVPILLKEARLPLAQIGLVTALYPWVWGLGQLGAGVLSDRWGRKALIVAGMWTQALGIGLFALGHSLGMWLAAASLLGIGTALVYPTLLAAVSDVTPADRRASAVGVYRLWRDGGYVAGALLAGLLADWLGLPAAILIVGGLTFLSGGVAAANMSETLHRLRPAESFEAGR